MAETPATIETFPDGNPGAPAAAARRPSPFATPAPAAVSPQLEHDGSASDFRGFSLSPSLVETLGVQMREHDKIMGGVVARARSVYNEPVQQAVPNRNSVAAATVAKKRKEAPVLNRGLLLVCESLDSTISAQCARLIAEKTRSRLGVPAEKVVVMDFGDSVYPPPSSAP